MEEELLRLYPNYKIYGPYPRKKDNRLQLVLHSLIGGKCITKLYAKFLLEIKLGRILTKQETVDHIDRNPLNDCIDNLRLLSRSDNASRAIKRLILDEVICIWCNTKFIPTRFNLDKRSSGPFCSRKCSGQYGKYVQEGGNLIPNKNLDRKYKYID